MEQSKMSGIKIIQIMTLMGISGTGNMAKKEVKTRHLVLS